MGLDPQVEVVLEAPSLLAPARSGVYVQEMPPSPWSGFAFHETVWPFTCMDALPFASLPLRENRSQGGQPRFNMRHPRALSAYQGFLLDCRRGLQHTELMAGLGSPHKSPS